MPKLPANHWLRRRPRPTTWAKVAVVVGALGAVATAVRYVPLHAEETAFLDAPRCAAGETPTDKCRRTADCVVVEKTCDDSAYARGASFAKCTLMLDVSHEGRLPIVLTLSDSRGIEPGAPLRVELYQGDAEAIERNGRSVRKMGGKTNAAASVRRAMLVSGAIVAAGLLAWVLLALRERRKA